MTSRFSNAVAGGQDQANAADVEARSRELGHQILAYVDDSGPPSIFSKKGMYGALMEWAMRDEHFKTQLFRFVDVLPTLRSASEISRHLTEYLGDEAVKLSPTLRLGLKAAGGAGWLFGAGVKAQVAGMARQFMLGNNNREIVASLRKLHDERIAFTVDILGEAVVSEDEADQYAQRYLELMDLLARETVSWPRPAGSPRVEPAPLLNLSVKVSALYSQIHPADPATAIDKLAGRLRPILRRAKELGAFINFDMESYALKDLTLRLFQSVLAESEFATGPPCGLAMQAYLRDCASDLRDLAAWARRQSRRVTVRLVKGAYWDYETVLARQRRWSIPVFAGKELTDANFEALSLFLLQNNDVFDAAFGTHNVRSIAHALAQADALGIDRQAFEIQMLYGMADPIKDAVLKMGCCLRAYCPVGELLPGMAYLVRRLLENTSNEGFLASKFAHGAGPGELLRKPAPLIPDEVLMPASAESKSNPVPVHSPDGSPEFQNEPHNDFTLGAERDKMRDAIQRVRRILGQRHPLVINHQPVSTSDWLPSLNPANQAEIVAYAAQASVSDAETAVAAARAAQPAWGRLPAAERAGLLEQVALRLRRVKSDLSALEILEAGKNWEEADADVAEAIDFCNFYASVMRDLARPHRTQSVAGESNFQHWWPRGVGVVIAPWNFPLAILTGMTAAALVAGNSVIMKPSDQTPFIAARLMEIFIEAGLPAGVVNLLTGPGKTIGAHLVAHPQIDFIAFTGSKEVGLRIWQTAGHTPPGQPNLKKVICEMGGKNCVIVDSDADLDEAVAGCVTSAFGYQGQKCSALSRLIVLADNYDRFVARLLTAAASLRIGPGEIPGNIVGPVINRDARQRIMDIIDSGKKQATLAWQGTPPDEPHAWYVPPTIFTDVAPASPLFREEIFGPVLAITRAKDFNEALALANDSDFALTAGCYSRSPVNLERVRTELICGNLYLNRPITGAMVGRHPFGGFKMSGGGSKAGGREYLQNFLVPRVVSENCLRRGFAPADDA